MSRRITSFLIPAFLFILQIASGQEVRVLSDETEEPVEQVVLMNSERNFFTLTDADGKAELTGLQPDDLVLFQHPSFELTEYPVREIRERNGIIRLNERLVHLEDVVVSANKWEQEEKEVPIRIVKMDAQTVADNQPQTSADLLKASGKVYVQKSQLGGGSPMIRGFSANRLLIVVDGVRMNNAIYRSGNLQNVINIDPNSLESAEVLFGPGSTIYGSDAMGGVMDFHTRKPRFSFDGKWRKSAHALLRYSSANNETSAHIDFEAGKDRWAFFTSLTYSDFDDLRMGSNFQPEYLRNEFQSLVGLQDSIQLNSDPERQRNTGFSSYNILQKIRVRPNETDEFTYSFHYSNTSDIPRYDRLTQRRSGALRFGDWYYGPQQWMMHSVQMRTKRSNVLWDEVRFTPAYQFYRESRHSRNLGSTRLANRIEKVYVGSANLDLEKTAGIHQFFYGLEAVYNRVNSDAFNYDIASGDSSVVNPRYPGKSDYSSGAVYLNYKINPHPKVTFNAGARYNLVRLNSVVDTSLFPYPFTEFSIDNGSVNGSVGLVYRPHAEWTVRFNAGTGFRSPNVDDAGKIFDSEPGSVVVPNPGLLPEYVYSTDLSIRASLSKWLEVELGAYFSYLVNAMVRADFQLNGMDSIIYEGVNSNVQAIRNLDNARIGGLELSADMEINDALQMHHTFSWAKGEDSNGDALRHIPPLFGRSELEFNKEKFRSIAFIEYSGLFHNDQLAPSEQSKPHIYAIDAQGRPWSPAWFTLGIQMQYQLNNFLKLHAGVENLLDRRYRTYSSGLVAPGRNFVVALSARF